jgi:hypothetical protein
MPRLTRAQRLQRRASRLRRLADKIRPATPDAPAHVLMRRLPSGRTVPASETGRTWNDIVAKPAGPAKVTGGRSLDGDHPSRKHDTPARRTVTPVDMTCPPEWTHKIYSAIPGATGLRRRSRRELAADVADADLSVVKARELPKMPAPAVGLDRRTRREMKQANASDAKKHRRNEARRDFRLPIDRAGVSRGVRRYMAGDPDPAVAARLQAEHDEQTVKIRAAADARRAARATR